MHKSQPGSWRFIRGHMQREHPELATQVSRATTYTHTRTHTQRPTHAGTCCASTPSSFRWSVATTYMPVLTVTCTRCTHMFHKYLGSSQHSGQSQTQKPTHTQTQAMSTTEHTDTNTLFTRCHKKVFGEHHLSRSLTRFNGAISSSLSCFPPCVFQALLPCRGRGIGARLHRLVFLFQEIFSYFECEHYTCRVKFCSKRARDIHEMCHDDARDMQFYCFQVG